MDYPIVKPIPSDYDKEPLLDLYDSVIDALVSDDKNEFLRLIKDPEFEQLRHQFRAGQIFLSNAPNIAIAVINGETEGIINLKDGLEDGMTLLHLAAVNRSPQVVKYLIQRGDNVDLICDSKKLNLKQATVTDFAVESIASPRNGAKQNPWTPRKSIFELLQFVCWFERRGLEVVRLLVKHSHNKERVRESFITYAFKGQLVQLVTLFLAVPEIGLSSLSFISLALLEKHTDIDEGLKLLLDVFSLGGDKLLAFIRVDDPRVWDLIFYPKGSIIASLLREVAHKKLGVSPDEYFLRFFKPVRPVLKEQVPPHLQRLPECYHHMEDDRISILRYNLKRKDIDIDYINRMEPNLEPGDADVLNRAIEDKLSSMSTLHRYLKTIDSAKPRVQPQCEPQSLPVLSGRNFEPALQAFDTRAVN